MTENEHDTEALSALFSLPAGGLSGAIQNVSEDSAAMRQGDIMILAGEPSGDVLAADLVFEIRREISAGELIPKFFGIGGPKLKRAGVELLEDMTGSTVFGVFEALRKIVHFKKVFNRVLAEAKRRQPKWIILVDYGGFNLRFAKAVRFWASRQSKTFANWKPRIVYYVPPQVWASREGRAAVLAAAVDLVVSIFPFEKDWYLERFPNLPVKYVGDPMATQFAGFRPPPRGNFAELSCDLPHIALLPGSRPQEIERHLPLMLRAFEQLRRRQKCRATVVAPNPNLMCRFQAMLPPTVGWQIGNAAGVLKRSSLAIAASGAVTRECAYLRVPTVVIYKLPWLDYQIAKRAVNVRHIAMPNILADERIFPELIQKAATPEAIAQAAEQLLAPEGRVRVMAALERVAAALGPPGASRRAAQAIVSAFGRG